MNDSESARLLYIEGVNLHDCKWLLGEGFGNKNTCQRQGEVVSLKDLGQGQERLV